MYNVYRIASHNNMIPPESFYGPGGDLLDDGDEVSPEWVEFLTEKMGRDGISKYHFEVLDDDSSLYDIDEIVSMIVIVNENRADEVTWLVCMEQ